MSGIGSSSMRALRAPFYVARQAIRSNSSLTTGPDFQPYTPTWLGSNTKQSSRRARPASPSFFTGDSALYEPIYRLEKLAEYAEAELREALLFPTPKGVHVPIDPDLWQGKREMATYFGQAAGGNGLKVPFHNRAVNLLARLEMLRMIAEHGGKPELEEELDDELSPLRKAHVAKEKIVRVKPTLDEFGRAQGLGRHKTASATVWIIPSRHAEVYLDAQAEGGPPASVLQSAPDAFPMSEILVNHLNFTQVWKRQHDRETILRPLRLTGLLGAYNVFAFVHGGGTSGQAKAVAMGLARALVVMREDTRDVLYADRALRRDPRQVERKKTNQPKARTKYTWVKR